MAVTMADIQQLRKMTGAGMMDCKSALDEAKGDFDKAVEIIRKKGQAVAAKREDREASEGCALAKTEKGHGAVVALQCETDFVAKNAEFIALTEQILDIALSNKPETVEELLALPMEDTTVSEKITERIGTTGEKMELGYYEYITAPTVVHYIHPGNKLATIVGFNKEDVDVEVAKDVAMQVAAMNPLAVTSDQISEDLKQKEMDIARDKAREAGRPEHILDRIAEGSLEKFFKDNTLLQQEYVKDNKLSIDEYMKQNDKELTVTDFKRVSLNA